MKVIVLTTQTTHHTYFIQQLCAKKLDLTAVVETGKVIVPFETQHSFEEERDKYEAEIWFNGRNPAIGDFAKVLSVYNVNEASVIEMMGKENPQVVLVFGTGLIKTPLINACQCPLLNLHGGDPEQYRGLDSHLWAIYHNAFSELVTTLHEINECLDDGKVVLQAPVPVQPAMKLHELRRYNTEVCIQLAVAAINMIGLQGWYPTKEQKHVGRYYSFMPSVLKEVCIRNFQRYTGGL